MQNSLMWQRNVLSNGLTVLLFPRQSRLTAQLAVTVKCGSNNDALDKSGAAHFLEHMVAGGSPSRIQASRGIEKLGGFVDFFTTHDYTMTLCDVLPERLLEAATIISHLLYDSEFTQENFETEKKVILQEIAEAEDSPWVQTEELLAKHLFKNHPVRHPVSGYRRTVRSLNLQDIKETHRAYYQPSNAVLTLAGNFSQPQLETVLETFSPKGNSFHTPKNGDTQEKPPRKRLICKEKAGLSQTYLRVGARTVSGRDADIPALELLNMILGGGASSRLFVELREKEALAYNVGSCQECGTDYGYFHIDCAVKSKNLAKALRLIEKELEKLRTQTVPDNELSKAKDMIIGAIYREIDSPTTLPETLTSMELLFENNTAIDDYVQKIRQTTADSLRETAAKYLQDSSCSTVTLAPKT
ncbi:MAG: insulinase family protein [Candidatus Bathyarchaeota archaeon]|nr:insulinase family protein [Candidatus Bathyarchaeota archaeon]